MISQKAIWWTIVIIMAIVIVWYFGKNEEKSECCTFEVDGFETSDGISSLKYCNRNGKYYVSGIGGFTGMIPEREISEQEFNSGWGSGKCVKTV